MKKSIAVFMLLVIAITFIGSQEIRYAYKILQVPPTDLQKTLDSYGMDGFRVVYMIFMQTYFFVVLEHPY